MAVREKRLLGDSYRYLRYLHHLGTRYHKASRGLGLRGPQRLQLQDAALIRVHVAAVQPHGDVRPTAPGPRHVRPLASREQSVLRIPAR